MSDSIGALELLMSVEAEFGLEFSLGEAERLKTVGDVVALVEARVE